MGMTSGKRRRSICGREGALGLNLNPEVGRIASGDGFSRAANGNTRRALPPGRAPAIVSELVGQQGRAEPQCLAAQRPPSSFGPILGGRRIRNRQSRSPSERKSMQQEWALWIQLPEERRRLLSTQDRRQGLRCDPRSIVSRTALGFARRDAPARSWGMAPLAEWRCPTVPSQPRQSTMRYGCRRPN
jgi:hypothetical protein